MNVYVCTRVTKEAPWLRIISTCAEFTPEVREMLARTAMAFSVSARAWTPEDPSPRPSFFSFGTNEWDGSLAHIWDEFQNKAAGCFTHLDEDEIVESFTISRLANYLAWITLLETFKRFIDNDIDARLLGE